MPKAMSPWYVPSPAGCSSVDLDVVAELAVVAERAVHGLDADVVDGQPAELDGRPTRRGWCRPGSRCRRRRRTSQRPPSSRRRRAGATSASSLAAAPPSAVRCRADAAAGSYSAVV